MARSPSHHHIWNSLILLQHHMGSSQPQRSMILGTPISSQDQCQVTLLHLPWVEVANRLTLEAILFRPLLRQFLQQRDTPMPVAGPSWLIINRSMPALVRKIVVNNFQPCPNSLIMTRGPLSLILSILGSFFHISLCWFRRRLIEGKV